MTPARGGPALKGGWATNILFFDYQHIPVPDANGNCVQTLRKQLKKRGVSSDVLSFRLTKGLPDEQPDACGTVYLESTWASARGLRPAEGTSFGRYVLHLPFAAAARIAHRLLSDAYTTPEKVFSWKACGRMKKKLERLCSQNRYDWVVAVSGPYCVHDIACCADLSQARLALYYFDPYSMHALFSPKNRENRMRQECKNLERADRAFASPEHREDWQTTALSHYIHKVRFVPYPNLAPDKGSPGPVPVPIAPGGVSLVYLGALHDRVRYPEPLFSLFGQMVALEPRLRLFVVGCKSGAEVGRQVRNAQQRLGEHLVCMDAVPFPQAMGLLQKADCAVNLGNCMKNQMPSKLLDYISAGKPILNLSYNRPCNTEPYIARYPWALHFYRDELEDAAGLRRAARKAVEFVLSHRGECLPWSEIQRHMQGFTAKDAAERFYAELGDV